MAENARLIGWLWTDRLAPELSRARRWHRRSRQNVRTRRNRARGDSRTDRNPTVITRHAGAHGGFVRADHRFSITTILGTLRATLAAATLSRLATRVARRSDIRRAAKAALELA
jgi:hypothetical protein